MRSRKVGALLGFVLVALLAGVALSGCGSRGYGGGHAYCNPDGSTTYYSHYPGYTRECTCRTVYHPCTHYYHAHY